MADIKKFLDQGGVSTLWSKIAEEVAKVDAKATENAADILAHGHTHIPELKTLECGLTIFNPGSVSLPKGESARSIGYYDGEELSHYSI